MSLGAWIFLSVLLLLVVLHKQFRKFFFWAAGIAAVGCGVWFGYVYLKDRLEARRAAREQAAFLKREGECVARLTDALHLPPGYSNPRYPDGETPDSLCTTNPDITPNEAITAHSWVTVTPDAPSKKIGKYSTKDIDSFATNAPATKSWATVTSPYSSIYRRCNFDAGTLPCLGEESVLAELKRGDRVEVLSGLVRASGGSDIRKVKFQQWTGWVKADALEMEEKR